MPLFPHLRVILESEPCSGRWNMAVDETLLQTAISADIATLRWYQWNEPTVSLGYFQKLAELSDDVILSQLPVVRRLSGGGAILHDDELTYCLTLPASQSLFNQPHELYNIVHHAITTGLRHLGFPVTFRGTTQKRPDEPMLCFLRQNEHDLTLAGKKVLGSAQRRRRGAIMQHGSLIRRASPLAKHLPGLTDLCNAVTPSNMADVLATYVGEAVAESWSVEILTENEIKIVNDTSHQNDAKLHGRL